MPRFAHYFAEQHGLILRRQALAAGATAKEVGELLRHGDWVAVRHGAYTTATHWSVLDPYVGRPRLEVWAAVLRMRTPQLISHDSAAYLHGLDILEARPRLVHVTRFGVLGGRTRHGVKHHKAPFADEQIVFVDGQPLLDIPRTVADIAREHGSRHGIVAAGSALRMGVSKGALWAAVAPMRNWPYVTKSRESIELADRRCENPGEDLTKLMLEEIALGVVHPQFGLRDRGRTAWVDFRVGRHLIEFDGWHKYQRQEEGGYAELSPADIVWREKRRQDWLCGFKLGMSRLVWADLQPDTWEATKRRLLREIADTNARFGTSIEDLAPYVIRRRRR
ncbi:type IV toxin-antitoxin system AbiEi family antitoxin domain-containing protein [Nocardioides sp. SR21]|uniref:type IV toxin-antitoxin system AbiEi family antitoxin domain-containing protein n=1 Tax=Nocardioides sp. SR21 TaxID=2919501 RepID=UPI001FAAC49F|nr:type IV toxin-antitoxin system AbiEi family antitoxin domain-containing protein [Nocardioides sp. SR21]